MAAANVLGVFAHVDTTVDAIRQLRAKGFSDLTVYSPTPVEDIEAVDRQNNFEPQISSVADDD